MTNQQKRQLALALMHKAAELVDTWSESRASQNLEQAGIGQQEAAQQIANWLKALPGTDWVTSLPQPN